MSKTITVRVDDDVYRAIRLAADGVRRSISNFLEFATLSYISSETHVSELEMDGIRKDADLVRSLKRGAKDVKEGKYEIVG